jgi:hypothetical protein
MFQTHKCKSSGQTYLKRNEKEKRKEKVPLKFIYVKKFNFWEYIKMSQHFFKYWWIMVFTYMNPNCFPQRTFCLLHLIFFTAIFVRCHFNCSIPRRELIIFLRNVFMSANICYHCQITSKRVRSSLIIQGIYFTHTSQNFFSCFSAKY